MSNSLPGVVTDSQIREARDRLWEMGILHWKLDATQKKLYEFYHNNTNKTVVVNASRRLGKSFFLIILALEQCIQHPKSIVKLIQPETGMIRKNLNPDFEVMLEDCPLDLRPNFNKQDNMWIFPNGSKIHLAGTDNGNYDKLRGSNTHLALVDEAGFCTDLKHIINSILIPLTTLTKGRIVLSSTTPPNPDHEFNEYMEFAEIENNLIRKTIFDAIVDHQSETYPRITHEIVADILKGYPGGINNPSFQTEYLCKRVFNSTEAVLPEFTEEIQLDTIKQWPRPAFYDKYVAMDIGFVDLTAILFAYWDYDNQVLVIEDELIQDGPSSTTTILANKIKNKEKDLWTNLMTREFEEPYLRVSDNNLIVINDLQMDHNITFLPTEKHDKLTYISQLRTMIENRQIIINPRCKTLISHMKTATWDKSKKDFKRSPDNGHYDAVAALIYLTRNVDRTRNPYPAGYRYMQMGSRSNVFVKETAENRGSTAERFKRLEQSFIPKSSFRKKT